MQLAARAAAAAATAANNLGADPNHPGQTLPNVPNGLTVNTAGPGLQVAVNAQGQPVLWQGANAPTVATGTNDVTVVQTQQNAFLQWQTFDIGKNTSLTFNQSAGGSNVGEWIAFNYVKDPSGRPSQILGSLSTTNGQTDSSGNPVVGGQVYVLNTNGIIFGGSSQVNVHTLVASSLPINPNLVANGLLNDTTNFQFLFSSSDINQQGQLVSSGVDGFGDASTSANYVAPPTAAGYGNVTVQAGAQLTSPANAANVGGGIFLVAPNVTNSGTISTPDGQTVLAAGLQVAFTAHSNNDPTRTGYELIGSAYGQPEPGISDPSLRGLDVYVGAVVEPTVNTNDSSGSGYQPFRYVSNADGGTGLAGSAWNGVVTNENVGGLMGVINAPRGDVTMAGAVVNQLGIIQSSTSVSLNGRIDLLANFNAAVLSGNTASLSVNYQPFEQQSSGSVLFGANSVTQIVPDASAATVVGTQLALPSQIDVQAHSIHLASGANQGTGAIVQATSGFVTMTAGDWITNPSVNGETVLSQESGQIFLDSGSGIDVSGSQNVSASVSQNIVAVQLRGTELADSPVQVGGPLQGDTVQVDIRQTGTYNGQPWVGTPLAITNGYVGLIQRTVGELTTEGGTVALNAGGSVVMEPGSSVNVSGGWINYAGANVSTTKLLASNGQIFDISQALPNVVYQGIYTGTTSTTDSKWGVSTGSSNPVPTSTFEPGYVQGGSGGSVTIAAPSIVAQGTLMGFTVDGAQQVNAPNASSLASAVAAGIDPVVWQLSTVPTASRLSLLFQGQEQYPGTSDIVYDSPLPAAVTLSSASPASTPALTFDPNASGILTAADSGVQLNTTLLQSVSPNPAVVAQGGFGTLNIENSDGTIAIGSSGVAGQALNLPAGGSMTMTAASIDIESAINAPGGSLNFIAYDFSPYTALAILSAGGQSPTYDPTRGSITLGSSAALNASGSLIDLGIGSGASMERFSSGGSVTLKANQVDLASGSSINVSGGALASATGSVTYGKAGSIQLAAGNDPFNGTQVINNDGTANAAAVQAVANDALLGGSLSLGATLSGYSGSGGGSLSILAPAVQIGGTNPNMASDASTLWLAATASNVPFFSEGGFSKFALTGIGSSANLAQGVLVAPGVVINPVVETWLAQTSDSGIALSLFTQPDGMRPVASLSLTALGARDLFDKNALLNLAVRGDLLIGSGSVIAIDPIGTASTPTPSTSVEGSVSLKGDTVDVEGSVFVPGGSIAVTGASSMPQTGVSNTAQPTVVLGTGSRLSTSGEEVLVLDAFGNLPAESGYVSTGSVLKGGSVTVAGNIVAQKGAIIDANGSSGSVVEPIGYFQGSQGSTAVGLNNNLEVGQVDTSGGSITLSGGQELFTAATIQASSGNPSDAKAAGGSFTVSATYFNPLGSQQTATDVGLMVTATPIAFSYSGPPSPNSSVELGGTALNPVLDLNGHVSSSISYIDAATVNGGGFSSVSLQGGAVNFVGEVSLSSKGSLLIGGTGAFFAKGDVTLAAPYVAVGQVFQSPTVYKPLAVQDPLLSPLAPAYGAGTLTVNATDLIDVGNLTLQNIGSATFNANSGAIRGDGTLDISGNMVLTAAQIYPPTASSFNIAAYPYTPAGASKTVGGSVTITSPAASASQLPLSAGGVLSVYAATVTQAGTLEAPYGEINLGTTAAVTDPLTGQSFPSTTNLTLQSGSLTSTSGVTNALANPTGAGTEPVPYGLVLNGITWIDPSGTDITATGNGLLGSGLPSQAVNLAGSNINVQPASGKLAAAKIDITGGGDLLAYQWIPGSGGTVDILNPTTTTNGYASYAVIPGFSSTYAPYAPYGSSNTSAASLGDSGYQDAASVGSQVYLSGGSQLPAGYYTLLPARYAVLPGAFLITQESGVPAGTAAQTDGSTVVSGYFVNGFSGGAAGSALFSNIDVASSSVVAKRAEYTTYSANSYFTQQAQTQGYATPRLPVDSGILAIEAQSGIDLQGAVSGLSAAGRGSVVEISGPSQLPIEINNTGTGPNSGVFYLNATQLSDFGAEGLLVGGNFASGVGSSTINVTTDSLTVDSGAVLSGEDVILVSNDLLTVAAGAKIEESGSHLSTVGSLLVGQLSSSGSGDGTFLRVSSDPTAEMSAVAVSTFNPNAVQAGSLPTLAVGQGALVSAASGSVTLGSTSLATVDSTAVVSGAAVNLASGQISLQLGTGDVPPATALVLSDAAGGTLQHILSSATSVSLKSYSSIDIYGSGSLGSVNASGTPTLENLSFHTGEIRGFDSSGGVTINAQNVTLDNAVAATGPGASEAASGSLTIASDKLTLGSVFPADASHNSLNGQIGVDQFNLVTLSAADGVVAAGSGGASPGLEVQGALTIATPLISADTGANQTITAGGALAVQSGVSGGTTANAGGVGASLSLIGTSVTLGSNSAISTPSGSVVLRATEGDVLVSGSLDAQGTSRLVSGVTEISAGGSISLTSDNGSVTLGSGSNVNLSAPSIGGNAGSLLVGAPKGSLTFDGTLSAAAGSGGLGGNATIDVAQLATSTGSASGSLSAIETALEKGGFVNSQNIRVRTGDLTVDGTVAASSFDLSADNGSIDVTGTIDGSGATGGSINLAASGSVTLSAGSLLNVQGQNFNSAGQGGSVTLSSGASQVGSTGTYTSNPNGYVVIDPSSTINMGVVNDHPIQLNLSGTSSVTVAAGQEVFFPNGTPGNDEVTFGGAGKITTASGGTTSFAAGYTTTLQSGSTVVLSGSAPGSISFAASGTGGAIQLSLPSSAQILSQTAVTDLSAFDSTGTLLLRAPQILDSTGAPVGVQVGPIQGTLISPSSVVVEGYQVFVPSGGSIDSVEGSVQLNGAEFAGGLDASGVLHSGNTSAIVAALTASWGTGANQVNATLSTVPDGLVHVQPGAEIDNPSGNLTLNNSWDLSTLRFGPNATDPSTGLLIPGAGEPGILTLRASGNVVFAYNANAQNATSVGATSGGFASLSDGFDGTAGGVATPDSLWNETLLPAGSRSWSYQIVAGSDLQAANVDAVSSLATLEAKGTGSVIFGSVANAPESISLLSADLGRDQIVPEYYQVIRTGTGSIDIHSGLDVQSLNPLATIYTAGQQAPSLAGFQQPNLSYNANGNIGAAQSPTYPAQYAFGGGNVSVSAQRDIVQDDVVNGAVVLGTSLEMPTNWLDRQGYVDSNGDFAIVNTGYLQGRNKQLPNRAGTANVASTSWWVDYSNYFEGVAALGGGNVSLIAGGSITNVDAQVPTNARSPGVDPTTGSPLSASQSPLLELGGGNLLVQAGGDISGGVYYVERGQGVLGAGRDITTNAARTVLASDVVSALPNGSLPDPTTWLPTTLFIGDSNFTVNAGGSIDLGPIANPFLMPQGINNSFWEKTYFSTYASTSGAEVNALTGSISIADDPTSGGASLATWYASLLVYNPTLGYSDSVAQPWLRLAESNVSAFSGGSVYNTGVFSLMAPNLAATAFNGNINLVGNLTLSPSPVALLTLSAEGSLNGLQINGLLNSRTVFSAATNPYEWTSSVINVSDANPSSIPGVSSPLSIGVTPAANQAVSFWSISNGSALDTINIALNQTPADQNSSVAIEEKEALHDPSLLHVADTSLVTIGAENGSLSGITLFSPTATRIDAGTDITDVAFYIQNNRESDVSVVSAGRDVIADDPTAPLIQEANTPLLGNHLLGNALSGDIQISGPGTLEVLTGRNLNLGEGSATGVGIASVGNAANPALPFAGADIVAAAGLGAAVDPSSSASGYAQFISQFVDPSTAGANATRYLPELASMLDVATTSGESTQAIWNSLVAPYASLSTAAQTEHRDLLALDEFFIVLRDAGQDRGNSASPYYGDYAQGYAAIAALFPGSETAAGAQLSSTPYSGSITMSTREIVTESGGNISILTPGGGLTVGFPSDPQKPDQGVLTEDGGGISIFASNNVEVGTSRIFTLQGGNEIIWSSFGNIAAGSGSKTVFSAPPTRVLVDPQSANVENDLAGLATGSGIGVLATLAGVAPGDVYLIAPVGTVDAGDAGIRASGNLTIAALHVLNSSNIQVGGASSGVPVASAPNVGALAAASSSSAASAAATSQISGQQQSASEAQNALIPSVIFVEVLGYGGDELSSVPADSTGVAGKFL